MSCSRYCTTWLYTYLKTERYTFFAAHNKINKWLSQDSLQYAKGSLKTDSEKVMLIVVLLLFSAKTFSVLFNIFLTSCSSISFTICIVVYGSANGLFFLVLKDCPSGWEKQNSLRICQAEKPFCPLSQVCIIRVHILAIFTLQKITYKEKWSF